MNTDKILAESIAKEYNCLKFTNMHILYIFVAKNVGLCYNPCIV